MTGTTLALRRVLPMLVWCVLVVIGLAFVGGKDDRSGPVAARQLPLNTLLLKSDLVPDVYAGRYVVKQPDGVAAGVPLRPQDVASQPVMPSGLEVGTYYSVPVAAAEIAYGANARATVHLCGKGGVDLATVQIVVVHCDSATPAPGVDCSALIQVPDAAASKLAAKAIKDQTTAKELTLSRKCLP